MPRQSLKTVSAGVVSSPVAACRAGTRFCRDGGWRQPTDIVVASYVGPRTSRRSPRSAPGTRRSRAQLLMTSADEATLPDDGTMPSSHKRKPWTFAVLISGTVLFARIACPSATAAETATFTPRRAAARRRLKPPGTASMNPNPKVKGRRSRHVCRTSFPADSVNHKPDALSADPRADEARRQMNLGSSGTLQKSARSPQFWGSAKGNSPTIVCATFSGALTNRSQGPPRSRGGPGV